MTINPSHFFQCSLTWGNIARETQHAPLSHVATKVLRVQRYHLVHSYQRPQWIQAIFQRRINSTPVKEHNIIDITKVNVFIEEGTTKQES